MMDLGFFDELRRRCVPLAGSLEVTHRCNLACAHCYQFASREDEMGLESVVSLLDQLQEAGCLFLSVTGGEPLLRADISDILEAAGERHFAVTLQTNALLLDQAMADRLAGIANLRVEMSLHAASAEKHDSFTGVPGSFQACLEGMDLLRERGIPAMTKTIVTNLNAGELEGIVELAGSRGATAFFSSIVFPRNDRDRGPLEYRISDEQLEGFADFQARQYAATLGDLASPAQEPPAPPGCAEVSHGEVVHGEPEKQLRGCGAGRTAFCVNPYGDLYPCVAWPIVLGNVLKDDFRTVWEESGLLEELREKEFNLDEECVSCHLLDKCPICRALSYVENGDSQALNRERCRQTRIWIKRTSDARG